MRRDRSREQQVLSGGHLLETMEHRGVIEAKEPANLELGPTLAPEQPSGDLTGSTDVAVATQTKKAGRWDDVKKRMPRRPGSASPDLAMP